MINTFFPYYLFFCYIRFYYSLIFEAIYVNSTYSKNKDKEYKNILRELILKYGSIKKMNVFGRKLRSFDNKVGLNLIRIMF